MKRILYYINVWFYFEIAYHCNDCEPIKPEKIKPTLTASSYEIKEK